MEFGSEVVLLYGKEVLVAAKDAAGVEVVNISAALGKSLCTTCIVYLYLN